jgi:molybdate transport system ATP-binding protein
MPGEARLLVRAYVAGDSRHRPRLDVDLALADGITVVMGHSGAGKTTLLSSIAGLVPTSVGRIVLDEVVLLDTQQQTVVPPHQRRTALVFQSLALFPHLSVWQNVAYGLPPTAKSARRERALTWLTRAHAEGLADRQPGTLSGGEAQRVALARALASEPRALLLDEPFAALDSPLRRQLGLELRALIEEIRVATVLVTHDPEDARNLGSRVLVLEAGRLLREESAY